MLSIRIEGNKMAVRIITALTKRTNSGAWLVTVLALAVLVSAGLSGGQVHAGPVVSIANCGELQALDDIGGNNLAEVIITQDIDCTGVSFEPLFSTGTPFQGTFDGQGHSINHLSISRNSNDVGLFSATTDANIHDITLASGSVSGIHDVGGLVGYATRTNITNVISNMNVTSTGISAGGIVGEYRAYNASTSTVSRSSATGNISASNGFAGGLIGSVESVNSADVTISEVFATGNVSGAANANFGGLIGYFKAEEPFFGGGATTARLLDAYATGNVSAPNAIYVGGLVGFAYSTADEGAPNLTIMRTYASGTVNGSSSTGGLIGWIYRQTNTSTLEVSNSFATGTVTGGSGFAGNAGDFSITSNNNYYDQTGTGSSVCSGGLVLTSCTGIDTGTQPNYFKGNHSSLPLSGWDFNTLWRTNSSAYPTFRQLDNIDADAIMTTVENAAPNSGDANNDGTLDSLQDNVTSYTNAVNSKPTALEASSDCAITDVNSQAEGDNSVADPNFTYPAGLTDFTLTCDTPGSTATITQYYYDTPVSGLVFRKYNANTSTYTNVPGVTLSQATIGGRLVTTATYTITDGGPLDDDGAANGSIVDPAGLASAVAVAATPSGSTTSPAGSAATTGGLVNAPNTGLEAGQPIVITLAALLAGFACIIYAVTSVYAQRRQPNA
jgi:hypothetical protein